MRDRNNDLRVIKNEKIIKDVFAELLLEKPLEKITVTELAKRAQINKGTFYLHYADIYELYDSWLEDNVEVFAGKIDFLDDFFDNPEQFVEKFAGLMAMMLEERFFTHFELSSRSFHVITLIADRAKDHLYATGRIEKTLENDLAIESLLYSLAGLLFNHKAVPITEIRQVMEKEIEAFF